MDDLSDHRIATGITQEDGEHRATAQVRDGDAGCHQHVACDLPASIRVVREEIAILRAMLADGIDQILQSTTPVTLPSASDAPALSQAAPIVKVRHGNRAETVSIVSSPTDARQ